MGNHFHGNSKYQVWMPEKLIELAHDYFLVEIAAKWKVDAETLRRWGYDDKLPEFKEAYTLATDIIIARLVREMFDIRKTRDGNYKALEFLINQMTNNQEKRVLKLRFKKGMSIEEKCDIVIEELGEGNLRPEEYKTIMDGTKTYYEIKVGLDNAKKMETILALPEVKEALKKHGI